MNVSGCYWQKDQPEEQILSIIKTPPKRWGRMDYASRIAIVEVGFILAEAKLLDDKNILPTDAKAGLIVGTKRGSLHTDLQFSRGLVEDNQTASPLLFSYTLPNIPLAEAASQYQIKGPVFSMYSETPYQTAIEEGRRWMDIDASLSFVIAGELDYYIANQNPDKPEISANFTIIK